VRVLLLANYPPDRQESMQRFARLLEAELPARGIEVNVIRPEPRFNVRGAARGPGKYLGYLDKFVLFPRALHARRRTRPDTVVHICDHSNAPYTRHLQSTRHLVTCHDLIAVRSALGEFPQNPVRWPGRWLQRMIVAGLNRARRVACVSEATRADVLRYCRVPAERVCVVRNGLNYPFSPMPTEECGTRLAGLHLPGPFLLHVGDNHWYKNRPGLLRIYAELRRLLPTAPVLVLAGREITAEMDGLIRRHNLEKNVIAVQGFSGEELRALYSRAELFLFPSLIEGFGWPILEAMACGCRVVTTGRPPMNEVGGEAAAYFDPGEPARAAEAVLRVLKEDETGRARRVQLSLARAAEFSTARMIDGYVALYRRLADGPVPTGD
jgi:glycosyltransferase involved in cell wall biosynthesis